MNNLLKIALFALALVGVPAQAASLTVAGLQDELIVAEQRLVDLNDIETKRAGEVARQNLKPTAWPIISLENYKAGRELAKQAHAHLRAAKKSKKPDRDLKAARSLIDQLDTIIKRSDPNYKRGPQTK